MLIVLLFAILNLSVGFAAAVLLGYGPQPWYALFLPSKGDNVIQIDAIDSDEETEKIEEPAAPNPPVESESQAVNQPFPEMNEPEDIPEEPEPEVDPEPVAEAEPVAETELEVEPPAEPVAEETPAGGTIFDSEEDNELEDFLAGRKDETKNNLSDEPAAEEASEIASADDIESMFAASQDAAPKQASSEEVASAEESEAEEETDDKPISQDEIAALFNS